VCVCVCVFVCKLEREGVVRVCVVSLRVCVCVCVLPDTHAGRAHASVKTHDTQKRKDGVGVCIWTQLLPAHASIYKHILTYTHTKTDFGKEACMHYNSMHALQ
jgi:hypothetical protein